MNEIELKNKITNCDEFIKMVKEGCFIDYDGYGNYATATEVSEEFIHPSDISGKTDRFNPETKKMEVISVEKKLNKNFTHVVWYNR